MISTTTIDRLIALGRRNGGLALGELRENLPIEAMTAEEIAYVVSRLEEAGISVEIDDELLAPREKRMPPDFREPIQGPAQNEPAAAVPNSTSAQRAGISPQVQAPPVPQVRSPRSTPSAVYLAGIVLVLLILGFIFWRLS